MEVWPNLSNYPGLTLKATISTVICFGYKELGAKQAKIINAWDFPEWEKDVNDDKKLCQAAWEILKDADMVITHNGKRFDWRFLQTRLMVHRLPPLPRIIHVDTAAQAKAHLFAFNARLNTLAKALTDSQKLEHDGWDMWVKVRKRDPKAMALMSKYCKQDVQALEQVYLAMRSLIDQTVNHNLFNVEKDACPRCGSRNVVKEGTRTYPTKVVTRYSCHGCRGWFQMPLKSPIPKV